MRPQPVLSVKGVTKTFGAVKALDDVSLEVLPGEIHALVGENGSGKSTLMNILFGDSSIAETGGYDGRVIFEGNEVVVSSSEQALSLGIGKVHQEIVLLPDLSVIENIKLNRETPRFLFLGPWSPNDWKNMRIDAAADFQRLGTPVDSDALVRNLPIGIQQLVEIARELDRTNLKLLILDEPSAALSEAESTKLSEAAKSLAAQGTGVIFISHRLHEVLRIADKVTVLRDGCVAASKDVHCTNVEEVARLMVGRDVGQSTSERKTTTITEPALVLKGFRVDDAGDPVRSVEIEAFPGEVLGIAGLSGHGKLGLLNGLIGGSPAFGEVFVNGQSIRPGNVAAALRAGLAFVSEDRRGSGLLLEESIALNICFPHMITNKEFLRFRWLPGGGIVDSDAMENFCGPLIEDFDIRSDSALQPVGQLSGGNQQKVCLARAVSLKPSVLFVAEPTRGIDVGAKEKILNILSNLAKDGMAIVIVSSELAELQRTCDRILVLYNGRVAETIQKPIDLVSLELSVMGEKAAGND